jgi:hypothetical protein
MLHLPVETFDLADKSIHRNELIKSCVMHQQQITGIFESPKKTFGEHCIRSIKSLFGSIFLYFLSWRSSKVHLHENTSSGPNINKFSFPVSVNILLINTSRKEHLQTSHFHFFCLVNNGTYRFPIGSLTRFCCLVCY